MSQAWEDVDFAPSAEDEAWLNAIEGGQNGAAPDEPSSWQPVDLAELPEQPPVQPTLGGLGIVYPGKRHIFSGPQESAKTLAAYIIALEVIRLGGRVVLLDFEMGRWDARNRLRELGASTEALRMISYVEPTEKAHPEDIDRLVALSPELVLVDAAAGAFDLQGLDDNKRSDVERFASVYVRRFWANGIATIVLDHVVKNAEARGNYAIGSERKVGGADVHLGFSVVTPIKRGGTGVYKIATHKDRGGFLKRGKLAEFELVSDAETHAIRWAFKEVVEGDEEHPFRPTHLMEKVSQYLERQVAAVTMKELEEVVTGKRDYIRQAVDLLVSEGFVDEEIGPRKARLLTLATVYREENDATLTTSPRPRPDLAPDNRDATSPLAPSAYRRGEDEGDVVTSPLTSPLTPEDPGF